MALIKWEPLRDIEDIFERYSRSLGAPFFRPSDIARSTEMVGNGEWTPRVDISESDAAFQIRAEVPGVCKDDVKVTLDNGVLTLQGERHQEHEEQGVRFHRVERSYGNFIRSFTLPSNVDAQQLKAHFRDGLLEVNIPKTPEVETSTITIPVD
ncbi:MAG: Hsp20/alpha crystallin family protein [Cyanobium sp.]